MRRVLRVHRTVLTSVSSGGLLSVSIPSERLTSGDYVLTVEGLSGQRERLATYRFRAAATR
jgi:hypothetical protein